MLVGLGIGVAPLISVVQDIIYNMNAIEKEENALEEGIFANTGIVASSPQPKVMTRGGRRNFQTKKAYFYWLQRERSSLNWFMDIMNDELTSMSKKGVIEMHNYITTMHEEGDPYSGLINMLRSYYHSRTGIDIVSGTFFRTHFGKPNWHTTYTRVALNHPNETVGTPLNKLHLAHIANLTHLLVK